MIINIQNPDRKCPKWHPQSQAFEWLEHLNAEQEMSRFQMIPYLKYLLLRSPLLSSECDSLTVNGLACHAADLGSIPALGDDFFN